MKSSMAAPSLRNSGLLATSMGLPAALSMRCGRWVLVPTGTVLLMTITASCFTRVAKAVADGPEVGEVRLATLALRRAHGNED